MTAMHLKLRGAGFAGAAYLPSPFPPVASFLGRIGVDSRHHTPMNTVDSQARSEVTELLRLWRAGDPGAEARLFEAVLPTLRIAARYRMSLERRDHTLQATALLNELYLKLTRAREIDWRDRGHFFAVAARAMRRYLIDYARTHRRPPMVDLDDAPETELSLPSGRLEQAILIDRLLDELTDVDKELCSVVEVKFFLGLTDEESAEALHLTRDQFQKRWMRARAWLFERTGGPACKETAKGATSAS